MNTISTSTVSDSLFYIVFLI